MEIEFNNKILETAPFLSLSLELSLREEGGDRIYVFRKMLILSRVSLSVYLPPSLQPLSSIHIYIKVIRHLYMYIYIYVYEWRITFQRATLFITKSASSISDRGPVAFKGGTRYSRTRLLIGRISSPPDYRYRRVDQSVPCVLTRVLEGVI